MAVGKNMKCAFVVRRFLIVGVASLCLAPLGGVKSDAGDYVPGLVAVHMSPKFFTMLQENLPGQDLPAFPLGDQDFIGCKVSNLSLRPKIKDIEITPPSLGERGAARISAEINLEQVNVSAGTTTAEAGEPAFCGDFIKYVFSENRDSDSGDTVAGNVSFNMAAELRPGSLRLSNTQIPRESFDIETLNGKPVGRFVAELVSRFPSLILLGLSGDKSDDSDPEEESGVGSALGNLLGGLKFGKKKETEPEPAAPAPARSSGDLFKNLLVDMLYDIVVKTITEREQEGRLDASAFLPVRLPLRFQNYQPGEEPDNIVIAKTEFFSTNAAFDDGSPGRDYYGMVHENGGITGIFAAHMELSNRPSWGPSKCPGSARLEGSRRQVAEPTEVPDFVGQDDGSLFQIAVTETMFNDFIRRMVKARRFCATSEGEMQTMLYQVSPDLPPDVSLGVQIYPNSIPWVSLRESSAQNTVDVVAETDLSTNLFIGNLKHRQVDLPLADFNDLTARARFEMKNGGIVMSLSTSMDKSSKPVSIKRAHSKTRSGLAISEDIINQIFMQIFPAALDRSYPIMPSTLPVADGVNLEITGLRAEDGFFVTGFDVDDDGVETFFQRMFLHNSSDGDAS